MFDIVDDMYEVQRKLLIKRRKKNNDFIYKIYLPEAAIGSLVLFCVIGRNRDAIFCGLSNDKKK